MKISSTYTVALQLLMICKHYETEKITSGFISRKTGADPAIIRRIMADLKNSDYIESKPGPGGTTLKKDLNEINLYEIYKTVTDDDDQVLKFYALPSEASSFEKSIQSVACKSFSNYMASFYAELKSHTVSELYNQLSKDCNVTRTSLNETDSL